MFFFYALGKRILPALDLPFSSMPSEKSKSNLPLQKTLEWTLIEASKLGFPKLQKTVVIIR